MKFTAVGDAIIQRRIQDGYKGYDELTPFIMQGDARFFNLETTLNREGECYASQFSGGTYIRTNPEVLIDLKKMGFNMTSFNNNHVLDFSYEGMLLTLDHVQKSGLVHAGVGRTLAEASAPRYLETPNGRVALIAVNTSFKPSLIAGEQTDRVPGRPGINGIRKEFKYTVNREQLEFIKTLADELGINVEMNIYRKEGYYPPVPEDQAELGDLRFSVGEQTKRTIELNQTDMARVQKAIYGAKFQSDYVFVSVHSHEIDGNSKEEVPEFLRKLAHELIDMGADAIVGHGPHLLRPIEVYKNKPIFYSLGDFILQLYSIEFAPNEFYIGQGLTPDKTIHELLKKRSKNFTVGLMEDPKMMQTVIPYWETENCELKSLKLMPVQLERGDCKKGDRGLPRKAKDLKFIEEYAKICKPYGVEFIIEKDGTITCKW